LKETKWRNCVKYFNRDLQYPDSLENIEEMVERRSINHFKDNLIKRRELIENDTLRYYTYLSMIQKYLMKRINKLLSKNGW
jgi:hypothetical protein